MKTFEEWLEQKEVNEGIGNYVKAGVAGAALALVPNAYGQSKTNTPTTMVQNNQNLVRHGVKVTMTKQLATRFIEDAKKALKNIQFFQAHIAPEIKDARYVFGPSKKVGDNQYTIEPIYMATRGEEIEPMLQAYLDRYHLLASYSPDQLVKIFSNSKNAEEQKNLNNLASIIDNTLIERIANIKDLGRIETVHLSQLEGNPDPRSEEMKGLHDFTARYSDYIKKICSLSSKENSGTLHIMDKLLDLNLNQTAEKTKDL